VFLKGYFVGIEEKIDLNMWVYQPGIPPDAREPKSTILDKVLTLASGFRSGQRITDAENASWEALEWQIYLENLPKKLQPEEVPTQYP
jgi:leukotriene-A4 hydrolase